MNDRELSEMFTTDTNEPKDVHSSAWTEWAKTKILHLQDRVATESAANAGLIKKVAELESVIASAERWMRSLRERSVHALEVGAEVRIIQPNIKAVVTEVRITKVGVSYTVVWWSSLGQRFCQEVGSSEVRMDDYLPVFPERQT